MLWILIKAIFHYLFVFLKWFVVALFESIGEEIFGTNYNGRSKNSSSNGRSALDVDCYKKEVNYQYFYGNHNDIDKNWRY